MINVFIQQLTPRIQYAFSLIFENILKNRVVYFTNAEDFQNAEGPKINYSDQHKLQGIYLQPHGLLHENVIYGFELEVIDWDGLKALFPVSNSFIPFDLFAASFYLVSRYEEYLEGKRDKHNRYLATESTAFKNNFIDTPLVNKWAIKLAGIIKKEYDSFDLPKLSFTYLPTIDIDNAWAYLNKGAFRTSLSMLKDVVKFKFSALDKRIKVLTHLERDSYDTYGFLQATFKTFEFKPIYFFLLNKKGKYDRSLSYKNYNYWRLILKSSKSGDIGIHPSYASNKSEKILSNEIRRLNEILGETVVRSRQHFLKFEIPGTFQKLISQGIEREYSMGYADYSGFRASIATPFLFFDLVEDCTTPLVIVPFQVMDVTLQHYQKFKPKEALSIIEELMKETASVGGTFVSLWHNESLNDEDKWKGWQKVYTEMTRKAFELSNGKNN